MALVITYLQSMVYLMSYNLYYCYMRLLYHNVKVCKVGYWLGSSHMACWIDGIDTHSFMRRWAINECRY